MQLGSSGKLNNTPYFAVGNNELAGQPKVGKTAKCPHCGKYHRVKYGRDAETGKPSETLGFVSCGEETYLVAIKGRLLS